MVFSRVGPNQSIEWGPNESIEINIHTDAFRSPFDSLGRDFQSGQQLHLARGRARKREHSLLTRVKMRRTPGESSVFFTSSAPRRCGIPLANSGSTSNKRAAFLRIPL